MEAERQYKNVYTCMYIACGTISENKVCGANQANGRQLVDPHSTEWA